MKTLGNLCALPDSHHSGGLPCPPEHPSMQPQSSEEASSEQAHVPSPTFTTSTSHTRETPHRRTAATRNRTGAWSVQDPLLQTHCTLRSAASLPRHRSGRGRTGAGSAGSEGQNLARS